MAGMRLCMMCCMSHCLVMQVVIESRNYTGVMLIDRNDELCILYEKSNIQVGPSVVTLQLALCLWPAAPQPFLAHPSLCDWWRWRWIGQMVC